MTDHPINAPGEPWDANLPPSQNPAFKKIKHPETEEDRAINAAWQREWRRLNPERSKAIERRSREKNKDKNREKRRESSRAWRSKNADRLRAERHEAYLENPEKFKTAAREWQIANPERNKENQARWHREHPNDWVQRNPERRREIARKSERKRKALMAGREYEDFEEIEIYERDCWICGICEEPIDSWRVRDLPDGTRDMLSVSLDHIIPISRGGNHTRDNVQAAHLGCNIRKHNKMPGDDDGTIA